MYVEDENINSSADFLKLREECNNLVIRHPDILVGYLYANIHVLANEHKEYLKKLKINDVAADYYAANNKIGLVKIIREKYGCDLRDAKMMADGYWAEFKVSCPSFVIL